MNVVEPIREEEQIQKIKDYLKKKNPRDYLMFTIGINTGLRISDILNIAVEDVLNKRYLYIREKKTQKRKRILLNEQLQQEITNYLELEELNDSDYLFSSKRYHKPISRVQAYLIIRGAARDIGIQDPVGTHSLRKTFGYHHYKKYGDIALLQKIFNHSSPDITLRYIGINDDEIDKSLEYFFI